MSAAQQEVSDEDLSDQTIELGPVDARQEDAFWERAYWQERYYSPGLDYEDYAPAYCVGYIGHAQYGGNYDDAEKSLCANWERIKGDSRLTLADARMAMRAAWERVAERPEREAAKKNLNVRLLRQRLKAPSFRLGASALR